MTPEHILVAIDFDDPVKAAAINTRAWAKDGDSRISLLGVVPKLSTAIKTSKVASAAKEAEKRLHEDLHTRLNELKDKLYKDADIHLSSGATADQIIDAAILYQADLIMKPADTSIDERAPVFGSIEKKLIRKSPLPVWIVRNEMDTPPKTLVVAIDNTSQAINRTEAELQSIALIDHAANLAKRFAIPTLHVVHAWTAADHHVLQRATNTLNPDQVDMYVREWQDANRTWLNTFVETQTARLGSTVKLVPKLVAGKPQIAIPEALSDLDADLLIIGSANRTGIPGLFLGNTAEEIINQTHCSTYIVKPTNLVSMMQSA